MVNAVLLRPFPAAEPGRLVALNEINTARGYNSGNANSYANFVDWRRDNQTLSNLALYQSAGYALTDDAAAEHVDAANVTVGFFETFGIRPVIGRTFSDVEETAAGERVVVLSHQLWARLFASDPAVLGRTLKLDAESYTVIGVMPPEFRFPDQAGLWTPLHLTATDELRGTRSYDGVARLKPGVTLAQASADLGVIADRLAKNFPGTNALYGIRVEPFVQRISASYQRSMLTLFGAVGCLLLITCVNVASLQLARGAAREREMAVRLALGSGRGRIVQQLLLENLLLGLAGGLLGMLFASWGIAFLSQILADSMPYWMTFTLDRPVLVFSLAVSVLSSLGFGLAPAWQLARVDLNGSLKQGGRSGSAARSGLMRVLVAAELTLALLLLTGAGLLVKSFLRLQAVQPGFVTQGVLSFRLSLPDSTYPDDARRRLANLQLIDRLRALPGVTSVGFVSDLPLSNSDWGRSFAIAGRPFPDAGHTPVALNRVASGEYFTTLQIPVKLGRTFDAHDTLDGKRVAIVDETFVKRFFPTENPLGQRVRYGGGEKSKSPWMEIVGVVGDVRHQDLQGTNPGPGLYVPLTQESANYGGYYALKVASDPAALMPAVREALSAHDRNLVPTALQPMSQLLRDATWRDRLLGGIFATFAALALLLSALGVYGVTAFATSQRTREFGVRMALGAMPGDVLRLVMRGGLRLALTAVSLGLAGALALTRLLASQLYGVSPYDPLILGGVALVILFVAALASWLPARRVTRIDPTIALRAE
jgi:putative ABC transport system permease protein